MQLLILPYAQKYLAQVLLDPADHPLPLAISLPALAAYLGLASPLLLMAQPRGHDQDQSQINLFVNSLSELLANNSQASLLLLSGLQ